jgi:hypothetical protein
MLIVCLAQETRTLTRINHKSWGHHIKVWITIHLSCRRAPLILEALIAMSEEKVDKEASFGQPTPNQAALTLDERRRAALAEVDNAKFS